MVLGPLLKLAISSDDIGNSIPRICLMYDLRAHNWNLICVVFVLTMLMCIQLSHKFAHVTTAELSWHVQIYDLIRLIFFMLKLHEFYNKSFGLCVYDYLWDSIPGEMTPWEKVQRFLFGCCPGLGGSKIISWIQIDIFSLLAGLSCGRQANDSTPIMMNDLINNVSSNPVLGIYHSSSPCALNNHSFHWIFEFLNIVA